MFRRKPERVIPEYADISDDLIEENRLATLTDDVLFVNQIPFLITSARQIGLVTTECLPARTLKHIAYHITRFIRLYQCGGFKVQTILMDNEFNKVQPEILQVIINTTIAK